MMTIPDHGTYSRYRNHSCRCAACVQAQASIRRKWRTKWDAANRHKRSAHDAVYRAIKSGALVRPNACEHCNAQVFTEASHTDYSRWLDVEWLCRSCHVAKDYGLETTR